MHRNALRRLLHARRLSATLGTGAAAVALLAAGPAAVAQTTPAAAGKVKVGFMLPYTGTYAALGTAIENGFRMYVQQQGGKLVAACFSPTGEVLEVLEA